jgi:voltage-gated potassium channel
VLLLLTRIALGIRRTFASWSVPLYVAGFVFVSSWFAMWLAEPGSDLVAPANYPWFFVVTAATVGYGDYFPKTPVGHLVGAYVIMGGIIALTVLFARLADKITTAKGRRMRGLATLDLDNHIVLLGYAAGRTERLVDELLLEPKAHVALCGWDTIAEHPMPELDRVSFVRGDLSDESVLARAGIGRAATVLIDGRDDNETLAIAVVAAHASRRSQPRGAGHAGVPLIAALRDMAKAGGFRYVSSRIQCVPWHVPNLLVEEAHDPGIAQVYEQLMTAGGSGNTYSLRLRHDYASFGEVQMELGRNFSAVALAVRCDGRLEVGPQWDAPVVAGTTVYYVAARRLDLVEL